jgi:predicted deacylase
VDEGTCFARIIGRPGDPTSEVTLHAAQAGRMPCAGVLVFEKSLGDYVDEGTCFARIIGRPGDPTSEVTLHAAQAGRMVTAHRERLVAQGSVVAKFTGTRLSASYSGGVLDP